MKKPEAPCKDCPDRHGGCHSECQRYIGFVEANKVWLEKIHNRQSEAIAMEQIRSKRIRSIAQKSPHR